MAKEKTGYCIYCNGFCKQSNNDVDWSITKRKSFMIWHKDCLDVYRVLGIDGCKGIRR